MQGPHNKCLSLVKQRLFLAKRFRQPHNDKKFRTVLGASVLSFGLASTAALHTSKRNQSPVYTLAAYSNNSNRYERDGQFKLDVYTAILALNWCVFAANLVAPQLFSLGVKANVLINRGEWWRLFTPMFLHIDLAHCAVNSYSLSSLGPIVEGSAGKKRFLVIYLIA
eukprot:TRINITY_DN59304_c0_g1_i2.p1 TRINITY_DN59304_c0_g1~~TRINITY_DN59304_c0_g1_i2.p1  ORF type:complete len:167 (-),score=18.33 TRINITY_DN59304_c0_g1_i2:102-602(-)